MYSIKMHLPRNARRRVDRSASHVKLRPQIKTDNVSLLISVINDPQCIVFNTAIALALMSALFLKIIPLISIRFELWSAAASEKFLF